MNNEKGLVSNSLNSGDTIHNSCLRQGIMVFGRHGRIRTFFGDEEYEAYIGLMAEWRHAEMRRAL